jgi:Tetracyclin repressor-like, C-terminal domain
MLMTPLDVARVSWLALSLGEDLEPVPANEELGEAFREQIVSLRLAEVHGLMQRASERRELRSGVDAAFLHELLFGPVSTVSC